MTKLIALNCMVLPASADAAAEKKLARQLDGFHAHINDLVEKYEQVLPVGGETLDEAMQTLNGNFAAWFTRAISSRNVLPAESIKLYGRALNYDCTIICLNHDKPTPEWFDAGLLSVPKELVIKTLNGFMSPEVVDHVLPALGGLTLREISEVLRLTMVRDKNASCDGCLKTRKQLFQGSRGLTLVGTDTPLYWPQPFIAKYIAEQKTFFLNGCDERLRPRGLLMKGLSGTGKSMGAKALCRSWGIPLFRLDTSVEEKWVGDCFSDDTMFMTNRGPRLFDEVGLQDRLATLNIETGRIEFQIPSARHENVYSGDMEHVLGRRNDILVTPTHRFWVRPAQSHVSFKFLCADELSSCTNGTGYGNIEVPSGGLQCNDQLNDVSVYSVPYALSSNGRLGHQIVSPRQFEMDYFLKFLGYFISEGNLDRRGVIVLSQKSGPIADDMINVCKYMFGRAHVVNGNGALKIAVSNLHVWSWIATLGPKGANAKRLPDFVFELSERQTVILVSALVNGDGSVNRYGRAGNWNYCTTSKVLADQVAYLAVRLGYTIRTHSVPPSAKSQRMYQVHCSPRTIKYFQQKSIHKEHYEGRVVNFTVENGTLLTGRHEKWIISGSA